MARQADQNYRLCQGRCLSCNLVGCQAAYYAQRISQIFSDVAAVG